MILPRCQPNSRRTAAAEPELKTQRCEPSQQTCRTQTGISFSFRSQERYSVNKSKSKLLHRILLPNSPWILFVDLVQLNSHSRLLYMLNCTCGPKYGLSVYTKKPKESAKLTLSVTKCTDTREWKLLHITKSGKKNTCPFLYLCCRYRITKTYHQQSSWNALNWGVTKPLVQPSTCKTEWSDWVVKAISLKKN